MLIREVVRQKEEAAFRNDVQLRWYVNGGTENLTLARSYMFTRKSVGQGKSSIDVLYRIRQAFLTDVFENRFMVIATYGHGKSHLALALANYFGKGLETEECGALLSSIKHAFGGEAEAQGYRDFKESRKRMLVVCLEGTHPGDLAQLFLQALRTALKNQPETVSAELPFWTREAVRLMESIANNEQERAKADEFLKAQNMDMAALRTALDGQDPKVYDTVRDVVHYVRGVKPDLGGPVSLAQAVEWAADEFCGTEESKPFGGVLILFDEFSAFLRNYSIRRAPGNPLQDLLNGVSNRKGKVVFTAFGQLEPTATIESVFRLNANDAAREAMLVELTRLPAAYHFQLYTTMEDVLDTYLWQDEDALNQEFEEGHAWPVVEDANDDCLSIFERHYERDLGWNSEQFHKRVTMGSFPLHPLTTALLCNIELLESANPRSVLGFVFEELTRRADLPVVYDQRPAWVDPVTLVNQFGAQLADEEWKQYTETCHQRGGDLTEEESVVLKGMLLHLVGKMPTTIVPYSKAISHLSGLRPERAEEVLQSLHRLGLIDHQVAQGKYGFWSIGGGARRLHDHVNSAISGRSLTWTDLEAVHKDGRGFDRPSLPVPIAWGHQNDWQAEQFYLTRSFLTPEKVQTLAGEARGAIIWLLGANDDDVEWFENNAQGLLDSAAGDPAAPFVIMLPTQPRPSLVTAIQKHRVLKNLSAAEISDFGGGVVQSVKGQVATTIKEETQALQSTLKRVVVPHLFAAAFNAGPQSTQPDAIIRKAYELAYTEAPPAFFDQYKLSSGQLRNAVKLVGKHMLENRVSELSEGANHVADGLLKNFMIVGPGTSWGVLSLERRLQEPTAERTRKAWNRLDGCVPANGTEMPVRDVIQRLISAPCGYDPNTLSLIFCAWFGYHRHDLRMTVKGAVTPQTELSANLEKSPAALIEFLTNRNVCLQRQDRSKTKEEIRGIIDRVKRMSSQPFCQGDAADAMGKLGEFLGDEANEDPSERQKVEEAKMALAAAIERADTYDAAARKLRTESNKANDIGAVMKLLNSVTAMQAAGGVQATEPRQDELRQQLLALLKRVVERVCTDNSVLPDLTHYQEKKRRLENAQRALTDHLGLKGKVSEALAALETAKQEIDGQQHDQTTIAVLNTMQTTGPLLQLNTWLESARAKTCHSAMAKELQAKKVAALEMAIRNMREYASSLTGQLDQIRSAQGARELLQTVNRQQALYEGTPEQNALAEAVERSGRLESFFDVLDEIDATIVDLKRRVDVETVRGKLQALFAKYKASLCATQEVLLCQRKDAITVRVEELEKASVDWLSAQKTMAASNRNLGALLKELIDPPAFLPDAIKPDLNALIADVQRKVDADLSGQVVRLFNQIGNVAEKWRVLGQLQELLGPGWKSDGEK